MSESFKPELCEDAVSRKALLDGLASIAKAKAKSDAQKALMGRTMFFAEKLPSVMPQQKTGKWIKPEPEESILFGGHTYIPPMKCSVCGRTALDEPWNFCPNCGAKMEGTECG